MIYLLLCNSYNQDWKFLIVRILKLWLLQLDEDREEVLNCSEKSEKRNKKNGIIKWLCTLKRQPWLRNSFAASLHLIGPQLLWAFWFLIRQRSSFGFFYSFISFIHLSICICKVRSQTYDRRSHDLKPLQLTILPISWVSSVYIFYWSHLVVRNCICECLVSVSWV